MVVHVVAGTRGNDQSRGRTEWRECGESLRWYE